MAIAKNAAICIWAAAINSAMAPTNWRWRRSTKNNTNRAMAKITNGAPKDGFQIRDKLVRVVDDVKRTQTVMQAETAPEIFQATKAKYKLEDKRPTENAQWTNFGDGSIDNSPYEI